MKKSYSTRKALYTNILCLILCIAMLIGTTFAWFTDSVSSGRNTIKSGNLKVELQYSTDYTTWKDVDSSTKLFDDSALWEPGYAQVIYLKVKNAGDLALKYQLFANIYNEKGGTNVDGDPFKLSQYLQVGAVATSGKYDKREDAINAVTNPVSLSGGFEVTTGNLSAQKESGILALVVYMPTSVGNEANYKVGTNAPTIDLGVILQATQYTEESDSFGTDYDEDAQYESDLEAGSTIIASSVTETVNSTGDTVLKASDGNVVITVPQADTTNTTSVTANITPVTSITKGITIQSGDVSTTYDIEVLADGQKLENTSKPITVQLFVGYGLTSVTLYHKTEQIESTYNPNTGMVTFTTTSFSPFTAVFDAAAKIGNTYYASLQAAVDKAKSGDKIVVQRDISSQDMIVNLLEKKTITIDLKKHTLNYTGTTTPYRAVQLSGANLTIKNGKINALNANSRAVMAYSSSTLRMDSVAINSGSRGVYSNASTVELSDVKIDMSSNSADGAIAAFNSSTLRMDSVAINSGSRGVYSDASTVELSDVKIDAGTHGVHCTNASTANLKNMTIKAKVNGVNSRLGSTVNINGGKINVGEYGVCCVKSTIMVDGTSIQSNSDETLANNHRGVACLEGNNNVTLKNATIETDDISVDCAGSNNIVSIDKSNITSNHFGVYQNGTESPNTFTITNSTITDTRYAGIYISNSATSTQKQKLDVEDCTITGPTAIEVKHTNASITGSTLISTAEKTSEAWSNGPCTSGYAIAVTSSSDSQGTKATGVVAITNCKLCENTADNVKMDNYFVYTYDASSENSVTIDGSAVNTKTLYNITHDENTHQHHQH